MDVDTFLFSPDCPSFFLHFSLPQQWKRHKHNIQDLTFTFNFISVFIVPFSGLGIDSIMSAPISLLPSGGDNPSSSTSSHNVPLVLPHQLVHVLVIDGKGA
jgi:hypothetical protein